MPVPSSYNDITQDAALRDHIGWVWYDREFFIAETWSAANVFVRFGSANYHAIVVSRWHHILLKYEIFASTFYIFLCSGSTVLKW